MKKNLHPTSWSLPGGESRMGALFNRMLERGLVVLDGGVSVRRRTGFVVFALMLGTVMIAAGCGGGGGRSGGRDTGGAVNASQIRQELRLTNRTLFSPSVSAWTLFDATAGENWVSAIGTTAGLKASVSAPCKEFGVRFLPRGTTFNNGARVNFYVDGESAGSLTLSGDNPYPNYKDGQVSYYQVRKDMDPGRYHTLTMEIASGVVAFDGWEFIVNDQKYLVDASDLNTIEAGAFTEFNNIRDAIETYYQDHGVYPNPASGTAVVDYLFATGPYFTSYPRNPFTRNLMTATTTISAGDYNYIRNSDTDYTLEGYGGRGTLVTYTPNSVTTDILSITLTSPANHITQTATTVTFIGTLTSGVNLTICCGADGQFAFPSNAAVSHDVTLSEGVNNIVIALADGNGNVVSLKRTITKDTTAPSITLLDPFPLHGPAGAMYVDVYTATTTVRVYVEPYSTAAINSVVVPVDSLGVASATVALLPGDNLIPVTATDRWNNIGSKTFLIKYHP